MRVLQINSVCGYGSTGKIATDLYKNLEENGHECLIAYGRGIAPDGIKAYKIGTKFDNYMHVFETRLLDAHGLGSKRSTEKFIKVIEKYAPDVIHLHNLHGYYINIEVLFKFLKTYDKPVIWTLHDCWPFTGHCPHFEYVGCNKWLAGCYACPQKDSYPQSLFFDNSKANYEKKRALFTGLKRLIIVTPSKWLSELVKQSFLKEYDIEVINNGIDLNLFKPTPSNFRNKHDILNKFIILGVASIWNKKKGFEEFIKLSKVVDDEKHKIVMVGLSKKQLKELPKNIIGIERTNSINELAEIYSAADVFFNPTFEDNYPTTNLEAISCGTPVITYKAGGSGESITKKCGVVLERETVFVNNQINSILAKIQSDNSFFKLNCKTKFDKNFMATKYFELYETIKKRKPI